MSSLVVINATCSTSFFGARLRIKLKGYRGQWPPSLYLQRQSLHGNRVARRTSHSEPSATKWELAGQVVYAMSVGGIETCFQLPQFDCNLDIGRCPPGAVGKSQLLLTHAHIDHAAGLAYYVSMRAMNKLPPPKVYCPKPVAPKLKEILHSWSELDSSADRCEVRGLEPGERINLGGDRFAVTFSAVHRVPTLGYALHRTKRKLKPELHGLDGPTIAARVRAGQEVHQEQVSCELCFCGDTTAEVIEREPMVRTARLLMIECTFVGDEQDRNWAEAGGHVHLDALAERAHLLENEAILLTHFSRRYPPEQIREAVQKRLPASLLDRVHLLLEM